MYMHTYTSLEYESRLMHTHTHAQAIIMTIIASTGPAGLATNVKVVGKLIILVTILFLNNRFYYL